jgi:hypothetical protein
VNTSNSCLRNTGRLGASLLLIAAAIAYFSYGPVFLYGDRYAIAESLPLGVAMAGGVQLRRADALAIHVGVPLSRTLLLAALVLLISGGCELLARIMSGPRSQDLPQSADQEGASPVATPALRDDIGPGVSQRPARTAVGVAAVLTLALVLARVPAFARAHELVRYCDTIEPMVTGSDEAVAGLNMRAREHRVSQTTMGRGKIYSLVLSTTPLNGRYCSVHVLEGTVVEARSSPTQLDAAIRALVNRRPTDDAQD